MESPDLKNNRNEKLTRFDTAEKWIWRQINRNYLVSRIEKKMKINEHHFRDVAQHEAYKFPRNGSPKADKRTGLKKIFEEIMANKFLSLM